jgi:hypothetical protein
MKEFNATPFIYSCKKKGAFLLLRGSLRVNIFLCVKLCDALYVLNIIKYLWCKLQSRSAHKTLTNNNNNNNNNHSLSDYYQYQPHHQEHICLLGINREACSCSFVLFITAAAACCFAVRCASSIFYIYYSYRLLRPYQTS